MASRSNPPGGGGTVIAGRMSACSRPPLQDELLTGAVQMEVEMALPASRHDHRVPYADALPGECPRRFRYSWRCIVLRSGSP